MRMPPGSPKENKSLIAKRVSATGVVAVGDEPYIGEVIHWWNPCTRSGELTQGDVRAASNKTRLLIGMIPQPIPAAEADPGAGSFRLAGTSLPQSCTAVDSRFMQAGFTSFSPRAHLLDLAAWVQASEVLCPSAYR